MSLINHLQIQSLCQQINAIYHNSREERIRLAAWEDEHPFSLLGELEILASTIHFTHGEDYPNLCRYLELLDYLRLALLAMIPANHLQVA